MDTSGEIGRDDMSDHTSKGFTHLQCFSASLGLVSPSFGSHRARVTAAVTARSLCEGSTGPQTQSVPPSASANPKTPLCGTSSRRSSPLERVCQQGGITEHDHVVMESLAFVANFHGLESLLDSGTLGFMIVPWVVGDGGRSYNKTLEVAPPPVARRTHYPRRDQEPEIPPNEQELPSRGGSSQRRAMAWM